MRDGMLSQAPIGRWKQHRHTTRQKGGWLGPRGAWRGTALHGGKHLSRAAPTLTHLPSGHRVPCRRIKAVRQELHDALTKINPDKDWSFVVKQIGAALLQHVLMVCIAVRQRRCRADAWHRQHQGSRASSVAEC